MILIADSGSTKTAWVAIDPQGNKVAEVTSVGINPFFIGRDEIVHDIKTNVVSRLPKITEIYFYGSGCVPDKIPVMYGALSECFVTAHKIEVHSDLVGAARALCGKETGIACILGTGSNTCYWDGETIAKQVSPCGFILGDEGSGAVLGKFFAADLLKGLLEKSLSDRFYDQMALTPAEIIDRVYRKPFPNRFLATFTRFMNDNRNDAQIRAIILSCFESFFVRCINQYETGITVNIIGSIGYYFQDFLKEVAQKHQVAIGLIEQSPIEGLVKFHKN